MKVSVLAGLCLAALLASGPYGRSEEGPGARAGGGPLAPKETEDACALLTDDEVRAVQGEPVTERKRSEQVSRSFRVAQCFYRTASFVNSVSLAATLPGATDPTRSGPRGYWRETFHREPRFLEPGASPGSSEAGARREAPPERVAGLGEEAFWVGNRLTGALYVLQDDAFLRISVGGASGEAARLRRSKALAEKALKRLRAGRRTSAKS